MDEQPGVPTSRDRATVIGDGLSRLARWSVGLVAIAAGAFVLGWVVATLWVILLPIVLALLVTTVLGPPASWLRRHGWPDALAAAVVLLGSLAILVGTGSALAPSVAGQAGEIANGASQGLQKVQDWVTQGPLDLSTGQLDAAIEAVQTRLKSSAASIGAGVFSTLSAATSAIVNLVIVLMLTFFFVKDGYKFLPWFGSLTGHKAGRHLTAVLDRCWTTLGGFIRTQGLVSLIDAVIIGIGLVILGVPLAVPLAVLTFFGGFIPIVGAVVAGALAVLVTLVTGGMTDALIVLAIILGVQQLEGNVLSPWLQGRTMNLHAAVVLLAVAAGSAQFGIVGAFLAVPAVATAAACLRYVNEQIQVAAGETEERPASDAGARTGRDDRDEPDDEVVLDSGR